SYYFGNLPKGQQHHSFLDVTANYIFKKSGFGVFLKRNNLFGKVRFAVYLVTDYVLSNREVRLRAAFVTLWVTYTFSSLHVLHFMNL
ncbi:MAG: hypothetical protein KBS98_09580, partial [Flavobacterium sp.]|nr:hypothetical protein [Candidatus Neoflavobacterium equi]